MWPFFVYVTAVVILIAAMFGLSYILGERHQAPARNQPYESGIPPTDSARLRLSAKFYLVAMFFVLFELEVVFVVAWAIGLRELGWAGYTQIAIFIGVLLAGLIYVWRLGALDWGPLTARTAKQDEQE